MLLEIFNSGLEKVLGSCVTFLLKLLKDESDDDEPSRSEPPLPPFADWFLSCSEIDSVGFMELSGVFGIFSKGEFLSDSELSLSLEQLTLSSELKGMFVFGLFSFESS